MNKEDVKQGIRCHVTRREADELSEWAAEECRSSLEQASYIIKQALKKRRESQHDSTHAASTHEGVPDTARHDHDHA
jgi:hypothetical protein